MVSCYLANLRLEPKYTFTFQRIFDKSNREMDPFYTENKDKYRA